MKKSCLLILIVLLFSTCGKKNEELICYHVVRGDYSEKIKVEGNIEAVNTTYLKAPQMTLSTIVWLEEEGVHVKKGDTVCIFEHPETRTRFESFTENLEKMQAQLDKIESDHLVQLAMLQAEIENNNIRLSINSLDSVQKKFAPPLQKKLISLEQEKALLIKEKLEKKYRSREKIGETEIRGMKSRIRQTENRIRRMQDQIDQLVLTAPKDGLLLRQELPNLRFMTSDGFGSIGGKIAEGSLTWRSMNILEIPDLSKMQVMAQLTESDYKKSAEGQKVILRVEAKNNLMTTGKIKRKMLTGKQQRRDSNIKMYEAIIEVDSCHREMIPGMNAECDIIINELIDTLVVPAVAVFEDDNEKFVYLREGKKFRKTEVKTSLVNTSWTVISSGIPDDSYIALSKPPSAKIIEYKNAISPDESTPNDSIAVESTLGDSLPVKTE